MTVRAVAGLRCVRVSVRVCVFSKSNGHEVVKVEKAILSRHEIVKVERNHFFCLGDAPAGEVQGLGAR